MDLHCHSTISDGTLSPRQLVEYALEKGLAVLALTDHDTIDGLESFHKSGKENGLKTISGIEISLEATGTFHLLGLNIYFKNTTLNEETMQNLQSFRRERNKVIYKKLKNLEYKISWEDLLLKTRGGQLGRPHFAQALVEAKYFKNLQEAFTKLLGKGKPAYFDKARLSVEKGLQCILQAGWVPIIAHPYSLGLQQNQWEDYIIKLKNLGLMGIEAYHPKHSAQETQFFIYLAEKHKLIVTAGSDFHGENKAYIDLDWVIKNYTGTADILEEFAKIKK